MKGEDIEALAGLLELNDHEYHQEAAYEFCFVGVIPAISMQSTLTAWRATPCVQMPAASAPCPERTCQRVS